MAQKYYYIKYVSKKDNKYFAAMITPAKCERSALFYINQKYQISKDKWELSRCEEIPYKIFSRLEKWQNIHLKKLEEKRKKNPSRINKMLNYLLWVSRIAGGKYSDYYDDDFKQRDMEKRKEIIDKINPDLVVSIHMNKFADASQNGAQVFYAKDNKGAENLANSICDELVKKFENARKLTLAGDYYMTNCTAKPSVIVECGFLSNPQEEANLIDEDYQNKMSYAIFCGIMHYFLTNYGVEM